MTVPPRRPAIPMEEWPDGAAWARKRSESAQAWAAFFTYLCMPMQDRSVTAVYQEITGDTGTAKTSWYRMSARHKWQERVVEYERWKRAQEVVRREQAHAEETRRWEAVRQQERERGLKLGQALLEKAAAMLQFPLAEVERVVSVYEDGREKEIQIFKPAGWNFATVARMVEVGGKLVQLMSEMATERHHLELSTIYAEADKVAASIGGGVTRDDVIRMAEQIAQARQEELDSEGEG